MANYLTPLRRIAEAVSARLNYDYLCFKGPLFDESYLSHAVSDIVCTFYDPSAIAIRKSQRHAGLQAHAKPTGRKPEIDYVAVNLKTNLPVLAIEAKWCGSSHCTAQNILWDLARLKLVKNSAPECVCGLLVAGSRRSTKEVFNHPLFREGTQHPLHMSLNRRKRFTLTNNLDHQEFIDRQRSGWTTSYPGLVLPTAFSTQLEASSTSANPASRFVARCWRVQ